MITSSPRIRDVASGGGGGGGTIGGLVVGGIAPAVLFIGPGNVLAQDPTNFTYVPMGSFHVDITDGVTYNSDFLVSSSGASLLVNDINTGTAEVLSMDGSHGATLSASLGLLAASVNFTPNQYIMQWSDNAGLSARHYGNSFGSNSVWSDGTAQSLFNATNTDAHAEYSDGLGNTAGTIYDPTGFIHSFIDLNGYQSYSVGASDSKFQLFKTPFQLYSDELTQFVAGDTLTDDNGNTADVVSDNGTGLILVVNLNIVSGQPFTAGSTITDQNFNTSNAIADAGVWGGSQGIRQDTTSPTPTRYADFIHTITSSLVTDKYEIKHPEVINFNVPRFTSSNALIQFTKNQNNLITHQFLNSDAGAGAGIQMIFGNGAALFMLGVIGNSASFGGLYTANAARIDNSLGNIVHVAGNVAKRHIWAVGGFANANEVTTIDVNGMGVSGSATIKVSVPTAYLHIAEGTATAGTAPLKFTPAGAILATPEVGAFEVMNDKIYYTIPTGPARKEITLNDSPLTPGVTPVAGTNGRLVDGATIPTIASGSYTPSATGLSNMTAVTPTVAYWYQIGTKVTVFGQVLVDPTLTLTFSTFELSLPVASNFAQSYQCAGVGNSGVASEEFQVLGEITNNTALVWMTPVNVTSQSYSYQFSYEVV